VVTHDIASPFFIVRFAQSASYLGPKRIHADLVALIRISKFIWRCAFTQNYKSLRAAVMIYTFWLTHTHTELSTQPAEPAMFIRLALRIICHNYSYRRFVHFCQNGFHNNLGIPTSRFSTNIDDAEHLYSHQHTLARL